MPDDKTQAELDDLLAEELDAYQNDPLGFADNMFPWGEAGTGLEGQKLEDWQRDELDKLGQQLRAGYSQDRGLYIGQAIQRAVASGHGIGKSAFVSIIILWAISTLEGTRGIVTANTDTQLKTKTWPELGKWYSMFLGKHLFIYEATSIHTADPDEEKRKLWRIDAIPWSKSTPESFAGLHNKGKRVLVIFDEASSISDKIWEVADAAFTDEDTELIWFVFGNPTRTKGRFWDCWHQFKKWWSGGEGGRQIDSRTVRITKKDKLNRWVETYGEDSDFVRVRVRGVFPRTGDHQFIDADAIEAARGKIIPKESYDFAPIIITLDSAWDGGDEIVCYMRQGLASKMLWVQAKNNDDHALALRLARTEDEIKADAVFIDKGYGTGVYSVGKSIGRKWVLIAFGEAALDRAYLNRRAEMYGLLRAWLKSGGAVPDDPMLIEELAAQEQIDREDAKIQLIPKEELKDPEMLGRSPGRSDALALTFAMPVKQKTMAEKLGIVNKDGGEYARPKQYAVDHDME